MNAITSNGTQTAMVLGPREKAQIMEELYKDLPMVDLGLPAYIYRADIIPLNFKDLSRSERTNILEAASLRLNYYEGYPVFETGYPFWEQMDHEPRDAFHAFVAYLQLPTATENAIRRISALTIGPDNYQMSDLIGWSILYCWQWRARAYDLFMVASYRRRRELRVMNMEISHYDIAKTVLDNVNTALLTKLEDPEELEALTPVELVGMMEKLVKIQRVSVGLTANGTQAYTESNGPRNASAETVVRAVVAEAGELKKSERKSNTMQMLLDDPEALAKAQELIVALSSDYTDEHPHDPTFVPEIVEHELDLTADTIDTEEYTTRYNDFDKNNPDI